MGVDSICANENVDLVSDDFGSVVPAAGVDAWLIAPKLNVGFDGILLDPVALWVGDVEGAPKLKAGCETGAGDAPLEPANKLANGFVALFSGSGVAAFSGD